MTHMHWVGFPLTRDRPFAEVTICITHKIHMRQMSMSTEGFEPVTPASERPQAYAFRPGAYWDRRHVWFLTQNILPTLWPLFDNFWATLWPIFDNFLTNLWPLFVQSLATLWPLFEHFWLLFVRSLNNLWPLFGHFDHFLVSLWPLFDQSLATLWPLFDQSLATLTTF